MTWVNPKETRDAALKVIWDSPSVIFYDLETTGLKPDSDYVIEMAALKYVPTTTNGLEQVGELHLFLKPPFDVPAKITEITGITNDDLSDKPSYEEAWEQIHAFFGDNPTLAGYNNTGFDDKFLKRMWSMFGCELNIAHSADVLKMARERVDKKDCPSHKLGDMAKHFGVDDGITFHNAFDDITCTKRLFDVFLIEYIKEYESPSLVNKIKPEIVSVNFWNGYRGYSRVYVTLKDAGVVYYDLRTKTWEGKDEFTKIETIDMGYVLERLNDLGIDVAHFKGSMVV